MVGAALVDVVLGHAQDTGGGQFLQRGLPVQAGPEPGRLGYHRVEQPVDERARLRQAPLDVDGADDRLEGVGQDRGLVAPARAFLAPAQPDVVAQMQPARHVGQRPHVDHRRTQLGQVPLGQIGILAEQRVGDDQPEHRVAEELQPLIGRQAAILIGERPVRERTLQQLRAEARVEGAQQGGALRLVASSLVLGSAFHAVLLPQVSLGVPAGRGARAGRICHTAVRMA